MKFLDSEILLKVKHAALFTRSPLSLYTTDKVSLEKHKSTDPRFEKPCPILLPFVF